MKKMKNIISGMIFLLFASNCVSGVERKRVLVILNGISGSGKTTFGGTLIANDENFLKQPFNWQHIQLDNVNIKNDEDMTDDQYHLARHKILLATVRNKINNGYDVICDTVISNKETAKLYEDVVNELNGGSTAIGVKIFLYCSFEDLIKRLGKRNGAAIKNNKPHDKREMSTVVYPYANLFVDAKTDCGFGTIAMGNIDKVITNYQYATKNDKGFLKKILERTSSLYNASQLGPVFPNLMWKCNLVIDSSKTPGNITVLLNKFLLLFCQDEKCSENSIEKNEKFETKKYCGEITEEKNGRLWLKNS